MKRSTLRRKTPLKAGPGPKRKPMKRKPAKKPANDATHHSAIRQAAQGELCTVQIAGICRHNTETTVLAHLPHEGGIMGGKVDDLSSCFACHACHDVLDGRRPWPDAGEPMFKDFYMRRAMVRTWRRLVEKGVIKIEEGE
ncbi:nuclease domain-containing protein [Halomonas salifodinae]|uniref:Nuclease domain-containing protein n=1 Tax=Halomonas salifodinae TaxID=438745 RepID=A0ABW2F1G3_9GAMM